MTGDCFGVVRLWVVEYYICLVFFLKGIYYVQYRTLVGPFIVSQINIFVHCATLRNSTWC